jgi:predicted transcriptional regulator
LKNSGLQANEFIGSPRWVKTIPNAINLLAAQRCRLPVESDRVRKVLSTILDSGALRIRDVTDTLRIPRQSINALMQYLKRKHLVEKIGSEFEAPYSLTDKGRAALAEMTRRLAA